MAKIKRGTFNVAYESTEYEDTAAKFFEDFEELLDEAGIEYEHEYNKTKETDYFWLFNKKISISFTCFHQKATISGTDTPVNIYMSLSHSWPQLFAGTLSTGTNSYNYEIILSSYGDIMLRLKEDNALVNDRDVVFVICKTNNVVSPAESNIGVYAPWTVANDDTYMQNQTPKFLVTSDTDTSVPIVNNVTTEKMSGTSLNYIINSNAPITALVPICAVSSQCVSINTKIMAIAPAPITGYAVLNGQRYYCVGQICMSDDEE